MADLGNTSFTNMEMGPASITDITKPYPAKEPVPETNETNTQEVSHILFVFIVIIIKKMSSTAIV